VKTDDILSASSDPLWLASAEALEELRQPATREALYRVLHLEPSRGCHDLLRVLFSLEAKCWQDDEDDVGDGNSAADEGWSSENLYWCGLLLYRAGRVDDVLPMWRAKNINFDSLCGFDGQFLVGAGVDSTIAFLKEIDTDEARACLEYINECKACGDLDWLEQWEKGRANYFDPRRE
jgi:hypothetical protein